MNKSVWPLTILLIMVGFNTSFAQGDFLESGQSGFQVAGAYTTSDNEYGVSANIGYSIDGAFDLGFSIGRNAINDGTLSGYYYGPVLIFHANKQRDRRFPISISYIFQYAMSSYSKDDKAGYKTIYELNGIHYEFGIAPGGAPLGVRLLF